MLELHNGCVETKSFFYKQAALNAISVDGLSTTHVEQKHFLNALQVVSPSLSQEQLQMYTQLYDKRWHSVKYPTSKPLLYSKRSHLNKEKYYNTMLLFLIHEEKTI